MWPDNKVQDLSALTNLTVNVLNLLTWLVVEPLEVLKENCGYLWRASGEHSFLNGPWHPAFAVSCWCVSNGDSCLTVILGEGKPVCPRQRPVWS